jgi:sulfite exporter TauE/SafE
LPEAVLRFVPFVAVIFFLGLAFRWDRRWARPAALTRRVFAFIRPSPGRSQVTSAATLGLLTPLLPCGPLYFFFGIALLSGSALRGAELMLAFGLGTLPLLWIAQAQFARLQPKLSPLWLGRVRFCLALAAAAMAAWRARMVLPGYSGTDAWICF